jgi:hypothetical protein
MAGTSGVRYFAVEVHAHDGKLALGRFAAFSGGEPTVTIGTAWNGGAKVPDRTQTRKVYGNITVSRPFGPNRDRKYVKALIAAIGTERVFTITKQDLDANDLAIGKPETWVNCLIVRVGEPTYAEDDSSPATWEIEFAPQSRA